MPIPSIIPRPSRVTTHEGSFRLGPHTTITAPDELADLVRALLGPATGYAFPDSSTAPGGTRGTGGARGTGGVGGAGGAAPGGITLTELNAGSVGALGAEGYRLTIDDQGVRGEGTRAGLRWAVQTLRQLLPVEVFSQHGVMGAGVTSADVTSGVVPGMVWELPGVQIEDVPAYPWRGCLVDVARWCHPIDFLHRHLEAMAAHKLNRLHLHLTDDQGWRFEVRRYPLLTEVGGWRAETTAGHKREGQFDARPHGGFYTQDELRSLVAHADRLGITIMPEIDAPGHMQAALAAYPQLGNDPDARLAVRTTWGISQHILNTEPSTVDFMRHVLDELCEVFPGPDIHIGGDEVPPDEWMASTAARALADRLGLPRVDDLLGWWSSQLATHLTGLGRRAGVWDELVDHGAPAGALVFAWRDESRVAAARNAGHPVIAAPCEYTYLDYAESDGPDEPLAPRAGLPLDRVYGYRPGDVLGVQGQLWSEYLPTPQMVEYRAWPRLAALAEVGWTRGEREFVEFRGRLATHVRRLAGLGVGYRAGF